MIDWPGLTKICYIQLWLSQTPLCGFGGISGTFCDLLFGLPARGKTVFLLPVDNVENKAVACRDFSSKWTWIFYIQIRTLFLCGLPALCNIRKTVLSFFVFQKDVSCT